MTQKTPWPGSQPVTARDIQAANRRLISAMRRHKVAKKTLAQAERDLREAKAIVKALVDRVARSAEPLTTLCGDCHQPVGTGATCLTCSAVRLEFTPGEAAFDGARPMEVVR